MSFNSMILWVFVSTTAMYIVPGLYSLYRVLRLQKMPALENVLPLIIEPMDPAEAWLPEVEESAEKSANRRAA